MAETRKVVATLEQTVSKSLVDVYEKGGRTFYEWRTGALCGTGGTASGRVLESFVNCGKFRVVEGRLP